MRAHSAAETQSKGPSSLMTSQIRELTVLFPIPGFDEVASTHTSNPFLLNSFEKVIVFHDQKAA